MAITSTRLTLVRGDSQEFDFAVSGTPDSATFELTHPAYPFEPVITKTLSDGISITDTGITVRIESSDLTNFPDTLNIFTYFVRVVIGADTTTIAAGALYVFPVG